MKELRFSAGGLALNCLDYGGEGRAPLLFLHGGSAHAHWWDFVAPAFTDRFHVLALDQRGHGDSGWPSEWQYGSRHYAADLNQIIGKWGLGVPVLVGHSMGGHNVLVYAAAHCSAVRAIVAIDTPPDYTERSVQFLRSVADKPARRYASLDEAIANFRLLPRETLATPEVLNHVARFTFKRLPDGAWVHKIDRRTMVREPLDTWDSLKRIDCPALIVKMTRSFLLDLEVARRMAAAMPRGRVAEIGDAYHHVMLDNPGALIAVLDTFFAQFAGGADIR
jgi:pimeloyl-ACP methyl ester carboxylesterase